jgi:putative modified peptide
MKDAVLTEKQVAELLDRLATDDNFRTLFENKPAKALFDMGVPAETVVELNAACLCPRQLVGKDQFQDAAKRLDEAALTAYADMQVPKMSLKP